MGTVVPDPELADALTHLYSEDSERPVFHFTDDMVLFFSLFDYRSPL